MTNEARRNFLKFSTAALGGGTLAACNISSVSGGDNVAGTAGAPGTDTPPAPSPAPTPTPSPSPAPSPTPTPAPAPVGSASAAMLSVGARRFSVLSDSSVQGAPYCIGFGFRKGDVPGGTGLTSTAGPVQVTVRNNWPDGSLKFAEIVGSVDLSAGVSRAVYLRAGTSASGTALTTADLRRSGITAQVGCGSMGTVSWSAGDWDSPFMQWTSGPLMSAWIYRKSVGSDAHLVAWLEVRLFANGAVEVLPWVENGYIAVAVPSNKSATYTFALGGTERFNGPIDLKHHQRTPLISGTALSYWSVADPALRIQHDPMYLMSSELVPTYFGQIGAATGALAALPNTFTPLQSGSFNYDNDSMASTGYQDPIGLLPQHDVLYLVGGSFNAYASVVRNGFSAGRYGIHYRDENTNRPLRMSQHPNRVISDGQGFKDNGGSTTGSVTPASTGGNPPQWDCAHSPSVGYLAYLVTGRWYFMEEVLFAATANYLGNGDNNILRSGALGLVQTAVDGWQTRSCAWDWRSKIQALTVVPDADAALRSELITCVENNINHFHGRYVAQSNNPYGLILPGETYNGTISEIAIWQQDFVTAAFGWAVSLDLPVSAAAKTKLGAFFQWKAASVVMRLGTTSGWWYINAAPYTVKTGTTLSQASYTAGTGAWPVSEAAFYNSTFTPTTSWMGATEGTLAGEFDVGFWSRSMWGNLQPAISYAVRHAVPGAAAGYLRVVGANNWPAMVEGFNNKPVWSVAPAVRTPAWAAGAPLHTWVELPGTSGAGGAALNAWGTLALIDNSATLVSAANGGHSDSFDNRVTSIDLLMDRPTWTLQIAPSDTAAVRPEVDYYTDGKPVSRHGYHHAHYISQRRRVMLFGARGWYLNGASGYAVDGTSVYGQWAWDPQGTYARLAEGQGYGTAHDPLTGNVWTSAGWRWNQAANAWAQLTTFPVAWRWPVAYDPTRRLFFTLQFGDGQGFDLNRGVVSAIFDPDTGAQTPITFNASAALAQFQADVVQYAAMEYDPHNDRFLFYDGRDAGAGRVYVITPNSTTAWDMSILALAGTAPGPSPLAGINGRFRYVAALQGFVVMPQASSNIFFFRTG